MGTFGEISATGEDERTDAELLAAHVAGERYAFEKLFRRHDRQACIRQMVDRKYLLHGKVVAANRHKAFEQKSDSLQEFREAYSDVAVSQLTVKPHPPQYKDMSRIMPGAVMDFDGIVGVMQSSIVGQFYKSTKHNGCKPDIALFQKFHFVQFHALHHI